MNFTVNSTPTPSGLTLNFAQLDLSSNIDFTVLNSKPFTIIEGVEGHYILPTWYFMDFSFNTGNPGQNVYLGDKAGFEINDLYAYTGVINLSFAIGQSFKIYQPAFIPNPFSLQQTKNFNVNAPLVLWQQVNDNSLQCSLFKIQIAYYLIPVY